MGGWYTGFQNNRYAICIDMYIHTHTLSRHTNLLHTEIHCIRIPLLFPRDRVSSASNLKLNYICHGPFPLMLKSTVLISAQFAFSLIKVILLPNNFLSYFTVIILTSLLFPVQAGTGIVMQCWSSDTVRKFQEAPIYPRVVSSIRHGRNTGMEMGTICYPDIGIFLGKGGD